MGVKLSVKARQLAGGKTVWDVQVTVEVRDARGRRKKITRTVGTKKEAIALDARLKVEAERGGARDARRTVDQMLDAWLEAGVWSPTTAYGYKLLVDREIRPVLGGVRLDRLSAKHLDGLYSDMRKRGLSGRSVQRVHAVLRAALGRALKWGWVPTNVALNASPGPVGGKEGHVAATADIERLMAAADDDLRLAIRLAAVTGARRSELCGLRWEDVDWEASTVLIERARVDAGGRTAIKTTKTAVGRVVPLDAGTLAMLRERRGIAGAIIRWSPRALSQRLADLCEATGVEGVAWHAMRHWAATTLIAGGTDIRTVSAHLGHSTPTTTLRHYAHVVAERQQAAVQSLAALLG